MSLNVLSVNFNELLSSETIRNYIYMYLNYYAPNVTSCASAIIDTKIENAMDGIKRHIIYTMRKEVEELNDHIVYLLERIRQLEKENQFLKSKASPEVLRELKNGMVPAIENGEETRSEDLEVAAIIRSAQQQQHTI